LYRLEEKTMMVSTFQKIALERASGEMTSNLPLGLVRAMGRLSDALISEPVLTERLGRALGDVLLHGGLLAHTHGVTPRDLALVPGGGIGATSEQVTPAALDILQDEALALALEVQILIAAPSESQLRPFLVRVASMASGAGIHMHDLAEVSLAALMPN